MKAKKSICLSLIFLILTSFLITLTIAATNTSINTSSSTSINTENLEGVDKAYACLKNQLGDNCASASSAEQAVLSLLAIAYDSSLQSSCKNALMGFEKTNCFAPTSSGSCDIKSTAQAVLALNYIGKNDEKYTNYLLSKRKLTKNLNWFLEIDANEETTCKIKVNDANEKSFKMTADKKITGSSSCLSSAENGYFLQISSTCFDDNFTISCDKDFITTLLYKKDLSSTSAYHLSSKTNSKQASGSTTEKVNAYCFASSSVCDYQGSLWASLALAKLGEDVSDYLPYLSSEYDTAENKKYFPSAFLYMLTNEDDYYIEVTEKQKQNKYWQEQESSGINYYDTALALLSLQDLSLEQADNSKEYLLQIQDSSGCWHANNAKDTSFILYAGWPKEPKLSQTTTARSNCKDFGYSCTAPSECISSDKLENFYCSGLSSVCCKTAPAMQTCSDKNGIICSSGQECTGSTVSSLDNSQCCLASCIESGAKTECESYSYSCKSACSSDEDTKTGYACNSGDVCCSAKTSTINWLLWILLILLIILVILAIIFREQVKIWFFRFKSKLSFGKGPRPSGGRPSMPPSSSIPMFQRQRQILPRQNMPMRRPMPPQRKSQEDSVFEDTMKKLRDMSK